MLHRIWRFRLTLMATSVGALAAVLRFVGLSEPKALVFDELYYARGAYSLLEMGYEGHWTSKADAFVEGDYSGLEIRADKVVHPPLGKWMIAVGMKMFGPNPFGWRFSAAVIGTVTVVVVALIAAHLFKSALWGGVAGVFLAIDGEHIVLSRSALLDIFLTFFVVVAFGLFLLDRRRHRRTLERKAAEARERLGLAADQWVPSSAVRVGIRWWRLAAIVSLGLATGVKWSGVYFAFFFILLSILWSIVDRRATGVRTFAPFSLFRVVVLPLLATAFLLPAVYVGTWAAWFAEDSSYMRSWAPLHEGEGFQWLPETPRSWVAYQQEILRFHNALDISKGIDHSYAANPWGFIVQARPTAFHWEVVEAGEGTPPSETKQVSEIIALGNPLIWWTGALAFLWALGRSIFKRDLLALGVISGTLAGWLPWTLFPDRVMFTFYTVAFSPWVVLTLVWALRRIAQPARLKGGWSRRGTLSVGGFVAATLLLAGYYLPLWTGQWIPNTYWHAHVFQCDEIKEFNWI